MATPVNYKRQVAKKRKSIHLNEAGVAYACLINITRSTVQAFGRGEQTTFRAGDIGNDHRKRAVQKIDFKVAAKMFHNRRGSLKRLTLEDGSRLLKLARKLHAEGDKNAYFTALAQQWPEFAGKSEIDVIRERRGLTTKRKQVKNLLGMDADESWSVAKLDDIIKSGGMTAFIREEPTQDGDDEFFDGSPAPQRNQSFADFDEDDEDNSEVAQAEPPVDPVIPVERLQRSVEANPAAVEDAEKAKIRGQLAEMGVRLSGQPSLARLKSTLEKAIAAQVRGEVAAG